MSHVPATPRRIEFLFDFISPYAFFAAREIGPLCARHGVELVWRPVLFAALLDHWGQLGPAEIAPKREFTWRDVARRAGVAGLALRGPKTHPFNPLKALRLSLAEVAGEHQPRVIAALFDAAWVDGRDLSDTADLRAVLRGLQLDADALLERIEATDAKTALREQTAAAVARGAFGVPTMLVGDELFWGSDQLPMIERIVAGNDPLPPGVLERVGRHTASAVRPGSRR